MCWKSVGIEGHGGSASLGEPRGTIVGIHGGGGNGSNSNDSNDKTKRVGGIKVAVLHGGLNKLYEESRLFKF